MSVGFIIEREIMPYFCMLCQRDKLYKKFSLRSEEDLCERSEQGSNEDLCENGYDIEQCPFFNSFNPKF